MTRVSIALNACVALTLLAACAAPAAPVAAPTTSGPKRGGTFTDASFSDATSLQPLITNDSASSTYQTFVYASLTRTDPQTLEVTGDLYEDKPELSADGKTLTWKLRKGLKWSDGTPLTAQDVEFTWQKMIDPNTQFPAVKFYTDSFSDVKAVDDLTVAYTLKEPGFCPAIRNSGLPGPIPKHVFEKVDINQNAANDQPAVINGLWFLKEWKRDDHATFSPSYAGYVDGQALLDTYIVRIVKDNTVQTQLFKTQDVDTATPDPVDWDEIKKLPHAQTFEYYSPAANWTFIGFNLNHPFFGDKRVRQAISYAIDVQAMVDKIRLGYAKRQFSNIPASSWAYTDNVPKFDYNPDKAKALLKEAGWTPGPDGILQKDGKPFKFRLFFNSGNKQREQIAVITQQYLKDVGIAVDIQQEDFTAYLQRIQQTKDFDMFILGWVGGIDPFATGNIWKSEGSQNFIGYKNPEVDQLYDQAAAVPGCKQEDRKPYYEKIQKLIAEDQGYVFLFTNESLVAVNKRIQVNPLTKLGIGYQLELWQLAP